MTQPTYSLGSEPPTTHLKNGKGRNTHCRQRLQTIGNTGLLSNSLSIKVFKIFYAFDISIKQVDQASKQIGKQASDMTEIAEQSAANSEEISASSEE